MLMETTPGPPGVLNHSHAVEKYRENGPFCSAVREMGHDELLINPLKTAFVWVAPA
jgi:hypothetical protein